MKLRYAAAVAAAVLALAGCGAAASHSPPARHASAQPSVHLTVSQQRQECAALDMIRMGYNTYTREVQVVAGEYYTSQPDAQLIIARAVRDRCPADVSVIPPGAPQP
jgi:hypothetical protein